MIVATDWPGVITATATLIVAVTGLVVATGARRAKREILGKVDDVHAELVTSNGLTLGNLADAGEGRRIEADVPPEDRTVAEQHYVDHLGPDHPAAPDG
jgi:hypothetical protein